MAWLFEQEHVAGEEIQKSLAKHWNQMAVSQTVQGASLTRDYPAKLHSIPTEVVFHSYRSKLQFARNVKVIINKSTTRMTMMKKRKKIQIWLWEILLAQTSGTGNELTEADEIKILSKLVKQRKDSAEIFSQQNRNDLAEPELLQAEVISQFLPEQMSLEEVEAVVAKIIDQLGASSMKDMGKVMGMANKELAGKTDGKTIASIVKSKLS